ncbi:MAG: CRTAC1 family protein, partial [Akkermansiaceae bacterium]|nr:CRTAC1 family protein [Akkermansiaceae bacterium]
KFTNQTEVARLAGLEGWWNGVAAGDLDRDGDLDIVATNFGFNTKYHASADHPALLYYGKFGTDKMRLVEAEYEGETLFPVRGKSCSTRAIPHLADKFQTFHSFALAELDQIYTKPVIKDALEFSATTLASGVFLNDGGGKFDFRELPRLAQIAPSFGVVISELDGDGIPDLYLAQNFYNPQPETGRMSGGVSQMLRGRGDGSFEPVGADSSGLIVGEDAKAACVADLNGDAWPDLLVGSNNGPVRSFINRGEGRSPGREMIRIGLRGKAGNLDGVGARITVEHSDGSRQVGEVHAGESYLAQSSSNFFVGTGARGVTKVEVRWPDGSTSAHQVEAGQDSILIPQPEASPRQASAKPVLQR